MQHQQDPHSELRVSIRRLESPQPFPHRLDLKQMRLLNEQRLSSHIQNPITVPVMPSSRDQIRGPEICGLARGRVFGVHADAEPGINALMKQKNVRICDLGEMGWAGDAMYLPPSTSARRLALSS